MRHSILCASATLVLAGCAVQKNTLVTDGLPAHVASVQVVYEPPCRSSPVTLCTIGNARVEKEVRTAIDDELVPALEAAGIEAVFGEPARPPSHVVHVSLLAIHTHYSTTAGSPIATPRVDLGLSLNERGGARPLWRTEFDEPLLGIHLDIQSRYDALMRRLANAMLDAAVVVAGPPPPQDALP